jgi:fibronectin type 3 domain-containing protein
MVLPLTISLMAGAYQNHPDYRSGAPGEGTCRDCHSSYGLNTGGGNIMVMGIPEMYTPGKAYTFTVSVYSPDRSQFCFALTAAAEDDEAPCGTFTALNTGATCAMRGGKTIMTTRNGYGGGTDYTKTWDVQWNAPSKAESAITFYGCGLGGDAQGNKGGDRVYTCKMTTYPAPNTPVQPKGLIVEPGDGHIGLTWFMDVTPDPRGGPVTYSIYWSDSTSGGLSLLTTISDKEYVHTGLVNGRTYRYQVSASNNEGEGPLSSVVRGTPNDVPERPRHLMSTKAAYDEITLKWDAPSSWGSGGTHSYIISRGMCPCMMEEVASGVTQTTYTDNEMLMANTTYHYQVRAVSSLGGGGVAMISLDIPATTPSFPLGLNVAVRVSSVDLTWEVPSDDGGDEVREYRIYRATGDGQPQLLKDSWTDTQFTDTDIMPDTQYEYTVAAVNGAGEGAMSTPVEAYIYPAPGSGDTGTFSVSEIPFSGLVAVGAVIIIGALMVGRLSFAASEAERREEE